MRIIAGKFKGKRLNSPKTIKTRPTLDRVKEAVFSMVESDIEGSKVLDLFAGTGALGIEMISRGAEFCLLNDIDKNAFKVILSNIQLTNCTNCVKICMKDYLKCLKKIQTDNETYDIIFIDPPYESQYGIKSIEYISNNKCILSDSGVIVYETDKSFLDEKMINYLENLENLECIKTKLYGRVIVKLFRWRI